MTLALLLLSLLPFDAGHRVDSVAVIELNTMYGTNSTDGSLFVAGQQVLFWDMAENGRLHVIDYRYKSQLLAPQVIGSTLLFADDDYGQRGMLRTVRADKVIQTEGFNNPAYDDEDIWPRGWRRGLSPSIQEQRVLRDGVLMWRGK